MDVTALFDDADTAEHALVNLQALGIFPTRYKIKALHIPHETGRSFYGTGGIPAQSNIAGYRSEGPNLEVQLLLTVEEPAAHKAASALISNHGRQVRVL